MREPVVYRGLIALCLLAGFVAAHASGQPPFSTVKAEVGPAWERIQISDRSVQREYEFRETDKLKGDRLVSHVKGRVWSNAQCWLDESEVVSGPPLDLKDFRTQTTSSAIGINTKYAFQLVRPKSASGWQLVQMRAHDSPDPLLHSLDLKYHASGSKGLRPYQNAALTPLPELFGHASFKLVGCVPSPSNPGCVRVTYEARTTLNQPDWVTTGWLDLDPNAAWSIRESNEETKSPTQISTFHTRFTVDLSEGIPLIREEKLEGTRVINGTIRLHRTRDFTFASRIEKDVPEREFTLSAYDLPEPQGVNFAKRTPTYVWLLAGAVGCALAATALRYFFDRPKSATPAA